MIIKTYGDGMADPVVRLDVARIAVDPGGRGQVTVTVTNPGERVEGYRIEVVGDAADWSQATPPQVSVYPQQSATAVIVFSPPAGSAVAGGVVPFGVRVQSEVDPDASAVAEGDLDVKEVVGLQATITPATSAGRWRGYHNVNFSNWGNSAERLKITASDPDEALGFLIKPPIVDVPLGGSARVKITVRTRKPFLRGNQVRLPFQVIGEREDAGPQTGPLQPYADPGRPTAQGTFNQKPILSKTAVIIGAAIILAAVGAGVFAAMRHPAAQALPNAVPPTPQLVATATGPNTIELTWPKIDLIQSYNLFTIDPQTKRTTDTGNVNANVDQQTISGLQPATEHCYQLQAARPNLISRRSNLACARTTAATPSSSPTPGATTSASAGASSATSETSQPTKSSTQSSSATSSSSPTSQSTTAPTSGGSAAVPAGQWIAVARFGDDQGQIEAAAAKLAEVGLPSGWLDGPQYPNMIINGGLPFHPPGPVAYAGPYATADEATQACTRVDQVLAGTPPDGQICQAVQPGQQQ